MGGICFTKKPSTLKKVRTHFSAKNLTSAAGLIPLYRLWHHLGGEDWINQNMGKLKHHNASYSVGRIITILILGYLRGAKHVSHLYLLGLDSALRSLWDWLQYPVNTTITRTLARFGQEGVIKLADLSQHLRQQVWDRSWFGKVTLDLDSTVETVYGHQQGAEVGYNPTNRGKKSYHAQLAFIAETAEVLLGWLRPGDAHTANGAIEFLKEALARLPKQVWKVIVRADAGFFCQTFLKFLEGAVFGYVVKCKMKGYKQFCEKHAHWRKAGPDRWTATFKAKPDDWTQSRTFVAVRYLKEYEADDLFGPRPIYTYILFVTNLHLSPNKLEAFYNQRATAETLIAQGKGQLGWSTMRTQSFWTNDALFQIGLLAYNLFVWFKRSFLPEDEHGQELETFRSWFIRAAGKVVHSGRRWSLDLGENYPWKELWMSIEEKQMSDQPF